LGDLHQIYTNHGRHVENAAAYTAFRIFTVMTTPTASRPSAADACAVAQPGRNV
jgi:hypothetical protein